MNPDAAPRGVNLDWRALVEIHVPEVEPLVGEGNLLAVGRPGRRVEERRRVSEVDLLDLAHPALLSQVQRVLARLVREVGDPFTVWRPGGVPVGHACRVGQVAHVTLLGRHGDNFAARFKESTRAGRREGCIQDAVANLLVLRPHRRNIGVDGDADPLCLARL